MKLEIQIERLRKIDFLGLLEIKEVYGQSLVRGYINGCIKKNNGNYLLYYRIINLNFDINDTYYYEIKNFLKRVYKNLNNKEILETIDYNFYENNKIKIDNYLLKIKLEEKLPEKQFKIKGKKI